jgi:argininosuccinate lyase
MARTVLNNVTVDEQRTHEAVSRGYMNATELADYLVRKRIPFRDAHDIVGKIVVRAVELGKEINELSISELRSYSTLIDEDVFSVLALEHTLGSKNCIGGTSPSQVNEAIAVARKSVDYLQTHSRQKL